MVEFIREPSGVQIMDLRPEFTWIVPAEAGMQSAYMILVASSEEKIRKDDGDIWNSGKIISDQSVEVECGVQLRENTGYCWKVMIWDTKGKPSSFSGTQAFITGSSDNYLTTTNKFETEEISPVFLEKTTQPGYFADFGKDAFGTLVLRISASSEDTIIIHLGEKLSGHASIDRSPEGTIRYTRVPLAVTPGLKEYTLKLPRDKRNTTGAAVLLPDSFPVITPFRYCEVENFRGELKPPDITQKIFHYYFEQDNSSFFSSDTILNQVWDICKYSMKATSFAGFYVDGDRERIPYEADAYINQLGHYYTDGEYSMARRTNEYFIDHPTWPTEWILQTIPMFYNDLMFTGNTESITRFYNALKFKTLTSIAGKDGLISSKNITTEIMKSLGFTNEAERIRDIVDWPPSQKDTGWKLATSEGERDGYEMADVNTVVNAFYYNGLVKLCELADMTGKKEDADFYSNEAERVKKVFNEKLLDKSTGYYVDGIGSDHSSLHANMMALAFGLVPDEYKASVVSFVKSRGMACSVYGAQYLLEGLYRAGEADYALELMTATNDRSWWNMIKSGSTITLEAWDMKYKPNSDWNHAWGAAPANIIPGYMWGIAPVEPGWRKARIRPQLAGLSESKIMVPTIRGNILAEYKKTGNSEEYRITIPGNTECEFMTDKGVLKLKPGLNKIKFNH
ncbi:MAG: family 78 glycoside hydrolase catalytic domain [Chloroflexota bacterium]